MKTILRNLSTRLSARKALVGACLLLAVAGHAKKQPSQPLSLVPSTPSTAPDYFCTWNVQGFICSYGGPESMRKEMNEQNIFGQGYGQRWVNMFPEIHQDLWLVLDDSWDIPKDANMRKDNPYFGIDELDEGRFPSFKGTPTERLRHLGDSLKTYGWRGLGLWVSAQKSPVLKDIADEDFWTDRLKVSEASGVGYWKVDWGDRDHDHQWRRWLSETARDIAPHVTIEQAMRLENVTFSDTYRTYDVENIIAQPVTISRVCELLPYKAGENAKGIVNCEDEPYIAAGLGCAIGIMRHPYAGPLPSGRDDEAFPATVRDLKRRIDEVVRAVRWHRIAAPFGVDGDFQKDDVILEDNWVYMTGESWINHEAGSAIKGSAPARVSRRMPLPVVNSDGKNQPFVLASCYPNGAVAVAAIGRTQKRQYIEKEVDIEIEARSTTAPIGIFGYMKSLRVNFPDAIPTGKTLHVYAQDLKADRAIDITSQVKIEGRSLIIPGKVISGIGLMMSAPGDKSAPGLVVQIK